MMNLCKRYDMVVIIILNNKYVFELCCRDGHLEIIIWLYNLLDSIDIRANNDSIFKLSCRHNHLEITLWLTTICDKYQLTISGDKIISHDP